MDALYGFTECEVSLNSQIIVIKDDFPWETDVHEILAYNAAKVVEFLKQELEIERTRLLEKIFYKSLERIFIENRLYKKIEILKTLEAIHKNLEDSLKAIENSFSANRPTMTGKNFSRYQYGASLNLISIKTKRRLPS